MRCSPPTFPFSKCRSTRPIPSRASAASRSDSGTARWSAPAPSPTPALAGGRLIVTPHADPAVVRAAKAQQMICVPGFFTPGEAFSLLAAGADGLKLFPAEAASPAVLKAMLAVLPQGTALLPVGGMDAGTIPAWRAAGAAGFGIGSAIYKPGDDAAAVAAKAAALRAA